MDRRSAQTIPQERYPVGPCTQGRVHNIVSSQGNADGSTRETPCRPHGDSSGSRGPVAHCRRRAGAEPRAAAGAQASFRGRRAAAFRVHSGAPLPEASGRLPDREAGAAADTFKLHVRRLCGRRTCAWEGPAFGGNVAVASGGARDACSSRERCGSRISVVPQFWLQDDPPPFLPRLSSPCAGASEAPPSRSGPPSLKTGCDA